MESLQMGPGRGFPSLSLLEAGSNSSLLLKEAQALRDQAHDQAPSHEDKVYNSARLRKKGR